MMFYSWLLVAYLTGYIVLVRRMV